MEFQTVGAAKLKALRPMAVVVKGTCSRLCEEERRYYVYLKALRHGSHSFACKYTMPAFPS